MTNRMTQTRHMTWQRAAGADPEESPCQTWLEEAVKENTVQVNIFGCHIFRHFQTDRASDLWQLFEGPSQFEKPGNTAALWVILARASCLCIRGNSNVFFATALHRAQTKMSFLVWDHTFEARRVELNEEFGLARSLHDSLDSFQLNPGPLHACI